MTRQASYKRNEPRGRGTLLAVLICFVLVLFIFSDFLRTFKFPASGGNSKKYSWDGKSSFAVALQTDPVGVFVFQKEPSQLVFLTLDKNLYFERGDLKSIKQLGRALDGDGQELADSVSLSFGAPIQNYVRFSKKLELNEQSAKQLFKSFASLVTPFKILLGLRPGFIKDTNITRSNAFRLWWQVKSLSINQVKMADVSTLSEEILAGNAKLLGVDTLSLNREISNFLDNLNIEKEGYKIKIVNESGSQYAGVVASRFIVSVGGKVISVEEGAQSRQMCQIVVGKPDDYTPSYLANIFGCDISNVATKGAGSQEHTLTLNLGQNFADRYFR